MKKYLYQYQRKVMLYCIRTNIAVSLCLLIFLASCDDFVEVDLPNSQLTAPAVFEDAVTANAAMVSIYAKMRSQGLLTGSASGLSHLLGNYTDELMFYGNTQNGAVAFYNNALIASNPDVKQFWNNSYNQIYCANAVVEGVDNSVTLPANVKNQLKGEALFSRALLHFYLVNLYGDVPYITTTDYRENSEVARTLSNVVYAKIIEDLQAAITLLPENYPTPERVRPNKYAAHALLARVYLYNENWEAAKNEATMVIENTGLYTWVTNLDEVFLKESTATIWQFSPSENGGNAEEGATFIFISGPPPLSALTENFINGFEVSDQRKVRWVNAVTDGVTTWFHPYKYKQQNSTAGSIEYSVVLRLAEMYLIRAEAYTHLGDLDAAKTDLNKIRNTAGLPDTSAVTQQELLDAILQERRVELFTEYGHRFFDLKRFGKVNEVLSPVKAGWSTNDALFPIPESELLLNPNLSPQNPGY
ncbi:RagB/SusD family nutrient uptake outer membrane protein [Flavobacterium luminosum]|uniref:RagB/SusD family nutrient uptake outer membrane protein n=1 Tax=Flavobacterium luminosum TaxID=2949086 RepID=A0ABT0TQT7_9FLAO|nr:RagB/SusD family nutrient uptake outer membrane protein [Flavobacterium sp. HXWNR70]MCL9809857.1 RagB/SusD family nutrient uptake outer membrane protein [Flavobacterium sp. HXWNR70]